MVSRRRALHLGTALLSATAGCLTHLRQPNSGNLDPLRDGETQTPDDVPEWTPEWTLPFDDWQVLGLDAADGLLYLTLSTNDGPSAVAAIDPDTQSVLWQTESDGEAVGGSHVSYQHIARGQWGLTLADETIYAVAGPAEERQWSAIHALDRINGERRWSFQQQRRLTIAGVADGLVVATGLEFFPPPGTTPVSHQTPESPLSTVVYGLDTATGTGLWTREFVDVQDVTAGGNGVYVAVGNRLVGLGRDGVTRFTYNHGPATRVEATTERIFYLTGKDSSATLHGVASNGGEDWQRDVPVEELLLADDRLYAGGDVVVAVQSDGSVAWRDDDYGKWLLVDPDHDTLYTRSGMSADAATAYDVAGDERWTFDPPSNNAWPEAATRDALVVSAITANSATQPFLTVYAVNANGQATAAFGTDTVFDAIGLDGMVYLVDSASNLVAVEP